MGERTVVVTGASDGIGRAAARQLHDAGVHVVVVGRNAERTAAVAGELDAPFHLADFARLDDVRRLADELGAAYPRIDVLAHNAGGSFPGGHRTDDGFELTVQVDHLAPFLLTALLMPVLRTSGASLVFTSSVAARWGSVRPDRLADGRFGGTSRVYGTAKLMNAMIAREFDERFGAEGLHAVAFHPGMIATSFGTNGNPVFGWLYASPLAARIMATPDQGAAELVRLALGVPGTDWRGGSFTSGGRETATNPQVADAGRRAGLWSWSERALGTVLA